MDHLLSDSVPLLLLLPELELDESLPELDDDPELASLLLLPPDEEHVGSDLSSTHTSAQARRLLQLPSRLIQCTQLNIVACSTLPFSTAPRTCHKQSNSCNKKDRAAHGIYPIAAIAV